MTAVRAAQRTDMKLRKFGCGFKSGIFSGLYWTCGLANRPMFLSAIPGEFKKGNRTDPRQFSSSSGLSVSLSVLVWSCPPGSLLICIKKTIRAHAQTRTSPMPHPYMACSLAALRAYWGAVSWFSWLNEAGALQGRLCNRLEHWCMDLLWLSVLQCIHKNIYFICFRL